MKKCSIIQFGAVHEDVIPSVAYLLNTLGYKPTIYLPQRTFTKKGNIFDRINNISYDLILTDLQGKKDWAVLREEIISDPEMELVVANTFQKEGIIRWYMDLGKPIIGIVHNPQLYCKSQYAIDLSKQKNVFLFTLGAHISINLRDRLRPEIENIGHFIPFYLFDKIVDPLGLLPNDGKIKIGILGTIDYSKRNLLNLAAEISKVKDTLDHNKVVFLICGGGKNRQEFNDLVKKEKIDQFFDFAPADEETGFVDYTTYIKYVQQSQFLISLFPGDTHNYVTFKIASVIFNSVCYNIPLILDKRANVVYDIPSLLYSNDGIGELLQKIANMSHQEYQQLKHNLYEFRRENIRKGIKYLGNAIENFAQYEESPPTTYLNESETSLKS